MKQVKYLIKGIVQGVGFRPFCARVARELSINGYVKNTSSGVELLLEGREDSIKRFIDEITDNPPSAAVITHISLEWEKSSSPFFSGFSIEESVREEKQKVFIPSDIALCADCLSEMRDPSNRRYRYPFINCTLCGPRYSIIEGLPYDRAETSMRNFKMCAECASEYHDPMNRRYHAQPNACPVCGPHLWARSFSGEITHEDPIAEIKSRLCSGEIVGIKGIGGFHIACIVNDDVIQKLRTRKKRPYKPFAVMIHDIDIARRFLNISTDEEALLSSPQSPIVVCGKRNNAFFPAAQLAPQQSSIGVMLPYTPLHHLIMEDFDMLVMTSANISESPIISRNEDAEEALGETGIVDALLLHDRDISMAIDDSVLFLKDRGEGRGARGEKKIKENTKDCWHTTKAIKRQKNKKTLDCRAAKRRGSQRRGLGAFRSQWQGARGEECTKDNPLNIEHCALTIKNDAPRKDAEVWRSQKDAALTCHVFIRRARGFVPNPIRLQVSAPPILAAGADIKAAFSLSQDEIVFPGQYIGDLRQVRTAEYYVRALKHFVELYSIKPVIFARDLHPDYYSTRIAHEFLLKNDFNIERIIPVQHHIAHFASVLLEHSISEPAIGVIFDGLGWGFDGGIWGGEIFVGTICKQYRAGHLLPCKMLGGDKATEEPWRYALSLLVSTVGEGEAEIFAENNWAYAKGKVANILKGIINSPVSTSCGRLFDGVAALLSICISSDYEGHAAMALEGVIEETNEIDALRFDLINEGGKIIIDWRPVIKGILLKLGKSQTQSEIAAAFHVGLAIAVAETCRIISNETGISIVALSGGVWQNKVLLNRTIELLTEFGLIPLLNTKLSPNDENISLGQTAFAASSML